MAAKRGKPKVETPRAVPDGAASYDDFPSPEEVALFAAAQRLSRREHEVVSMTIKEAPRGTMARKLGITDGTIDTYCDRLHKKLKVKTAIGLVLKVARYALWLRENRAGS